MNDEKKDSRAEKVAQKARATAIGALNAAFKTYQRWQVADCVAKDTHIDAGDYTTFVDFVKDELSAK